MSHGDEVASLPHGFEVVARSQQGEVAAIQNPSRKFYGLQYHPKVIHTPEVDRSNTAYTVKRRVQYRRVSIVQQSLYGKNS